MPPLYFIPVNFKNFEITYWFFNRIMLLYTQRGYIVMGFENILESKINNRYILESQGSCNLSCGSNLASLEVKQGDIILDLGCGRGNETIQAARLSGINGVAIGLDITEAMINVAANNAEGAGINNVSFMIGDIENLPFGENYFDAIMSNCVINHAKDKSNVYRKIYKTLKVGGRFVVSDAVTKYPLPPEIKMDPEAWAQCFGGAITEEEYLNSIRSAGFESVEILKRKEYVKNGYDFISLTLKAFKHMV